MTYSEMRKVQGAAGAASPTKHTPGPWTVQTDGRRFDVVAEDAYPVADVRWRKRETDEANAKLIAAAPELAFQLTKLLAFIEGMREGGTPVIPEIDDSAKAVLRAAGLIAGDAA